MGKALQLMFKIEDEREALKQKIEAGYLASDPRTLAMDRVLRTMYYDEALLYKSWRLEYLYLGEGHPHWRLYNARSVWGIASVWAESPDVCESRHLLPVRRKLAAYLIALGWDMDQITVGRAITRIKADVSHQYRLFSVNLGKKRTPRLFDALAEGALA